MNKGKLSSIFVFDGQLMNKRQFNYRYKKLLNSLSAEDRELFLKRQNAHTLIYRESLK